MPNIIDRIADTLQRYGWIKGTEGSPVVGFCLIGAARQCGCTNLDEQSEVKHTLMNAIEIVDPHRRSFSAQMIITFNDDLATTYEDVQLMLKHASQLWDERHATRERV